MTRVPQVSGTTFGGPRYGYDHDGKGLIESVDAAAVPETCGLAALASPEVGTEERDGRT